MILEDFGNVPAIMGILVFFVILNCLRVDLGPAWDMCKSPHSANASILIRDTIRTHDKDTYRHIAKSQCV